MMTLSTKLVRKVGLSMLAPMLFVIVPSCTSLTETPHDALTSAANSAEAARLIFSEVFAWPT